MHKFAADVYLSHKDTIPDMDMASIRSKMGIYSW
jgi:hypothetical protein